MTKKKLLETYDKIKELIGEDEVLDELLNIHETEDILELSKIEFEEFINYMIEEHVLESEIAELDDKISYMTKLDID
jgi:hypothetical protein